MLTEDDEKSENPAEIPVVLLVNLGTPESPSPSDIRRFLREFLSDRRVIELHPLIWKPVLEGVILPFRPSRVAPNYRSIWTEHGSPLMAYSIAQAESLSELLGGQAKVALAMRYGKPSIESVLDDVFAKGHRRVLLLPAYPQYAASSAGTVTDALARYILKRRNHMEVRTIRSFPTEPAYIEALAHAIEEDWARQGRPDFAAGDKFLASFHSIPQKMHDAGDPYKHECMATANALRARLHLDEDQLLVTFQSVFGPAKWLGPATIDTVAELARSGTRRLDVICPGFMTDCLETVDEIAKLNRDAFLEAGGTDFTYIPWGNASAGAVDTLGALARRGLAGWVNFSDEA